MTKGSRVPVVGKQISGKVQLTKFPGKLMRQGRRSFWGGMCRVLQPLQRSWVPPTGEHPAPMDTPLRAVTVASDLACCHKVPLGTLAGGRLPSLEAQEPKPSHMAVPPGVPNKAETSMDLPIPPDPQALRPLRDGPRSPDTLSILKAQLTHSLPGSLQWLGPQVTCTDPP